MNHLCCLKSSISCGVNFIIIVYYFVLQFSFDRLPIIYVLLIVVLNVDYSSWIKY
nr:MAG TPA: hypothetical protein [Caudoviricetes sp.]